MSLAAGDRLGRYEIVAPLGAGGMGEVFRASDLELGREVAVKVLPESVATDPVRLERFRREARALAALTHPNLLEVYDVGSSDGVHYVVTELLEGDSLRHRIPVSGMPWQKVSEIGAAVADGLAAAHDKGIVHRDIKPDNLFLTADGRVKILDFGLARVKEVVGADAETATLTPPATEAGVVMGTPGYMAPEQVSGGVVDGRTDIFALGCVLYEMVAGKRPFTGSSGIEVMAAILKEEPPQLSSSGARVPVDLERAVHRCLEKRPEARFQSAADLAYSLRSVGSGLPAPLMATPAAGARTATRRRWWRSVVAVVVVAAAAVVSWQLATPEGGGEDAARTRLVENRVVVMPFEVASPDPSLGGIARAADETMVRQLAEYGGYLRAAYSDVVAQPEFMELDVVPVPRTVPVAGATATPSETVVEAARRQRAATVIAGSIFDEGGDGVVQGTVTDARSGEVVAVWSARWSLAERPQHALNECAERLAISVVAHLHWMQLSWAAAHPPAPEAFRAFMEGMKDAYSYRLGRAEELLRKAIELEPGWARPKLFTAWGFAMLGRSDESLDLLRQVMDLRGLSPIDELLARFHLAGLDGRYAEALHWAYEAHRLAPRHTHLTRWVGQAAIKCNRPAFAVQVFESIPGERLDQRGLSELTAALHMLGRHEHELLLWREMAERRPDPGSIFYLNGTLRALAASGRFVEIDELLEVCKNTPGAASWIVDSMLVASRELAAHGHAESAESLAARGLELLDSEGSTSRRAANLRCELLDLLGRPEEGREALRDLLPTDPDTWQTWTIRGVLAARAGDAATARTMAERLAGVEDPPQRWQALYSRSCIASRLGDNAEALRLLRQALSSGFEYGLLIHTDQDLRPLWNEPDFQEILRPKG